MITKGYIGDDTEVDIFYDYDKGQKSKIYGPPENCQPGFPPSVEITEVKLGDDDIMVSLSARWVQDWEERILEKILTDGVMP
jgi:hypothetical protein